MRKLIIIWMLNADPSVLPRLLSRTVRLFLSYDVMQVLVEKLRPSRRGCRLQAGAGRSLTMRLCVEYYTCAKPLTNSHKVAA